MPPPSDRVLRDQIDLYRLNCQAKGMWVHPEQKDHGPACWEPMVVDMVWVCVEKSNDSAGWRVTNLPGSPSSCYFSGGAHTPWCGDAALGGV